MNGSERPDRADPPTDTRSAIDLVHDGRSGQDGAADVRRVRRFLALGLAVALAAVAVAALTWWAVASGAKPCQAGYEYRYQYTLIVGKTQVAQYRCVKA